MVALQPTNPTDPVGPLDLDPRMCPICTDKEIKHKHTYCNACVESQAAAKRDAERQGRLKEFEDAMKIPQEAITLIRQFIETCPSKGRGRQRSCFNWAEFVEVTYAKREIKRGSKDIMMCKTAFKNTWTANLIPLQAV